MSQSSRAYAEYESQVGGVLSHVIKRDGEFLVCDPAELRTPLVEVLDREAPKVREIAMDCLPQDLKELQYMTRSRLAGIIEAMRAELLDERRKTLDTFFNYLFAEGPDILKVMERLFIYARASYRDHVWRMSQSEMAALFGHSRQNWQHLEERIVEELVERYSRSEFTSSGGKSHAARLTYANVQAGNKCRANGRRSGDELPPLAESVEPDFPPLTERAKARAERMRKEAARREIAALCDCDPEDIDLNLISLPND